MDGNEVVRRASHGEGVGDRGLGKRKIYFVGCIRDGEIVEGVGTGDYLGDEAVESYYSLSRSEGTIVGPVALDAYAVVGSGGVKRGAGADGEVAGDGGGAV